MASCLFVVDGNNLLHRASFVVRDPLVNAEGVDVAAASVFVAMLQKTVRSATARLGVSDAKIVVVFDDPSGVAVRRAIFPDYKASSSSSERVKDCLELLRDVLPGVGVPVLQVPHVEADDVVSCIVDAACGVVDSTVVVSNDKDLLATVSQDSVVVLPGGSSLKVFGEVEVFEKLGVLPAQVAVFKALVGDSSDNLPGVVGVGPKKALKLIADAAARGVEVEDLLSGSQRDQFELMFRCVSFMGCDLPPLGELLESAVSCPPFSWNNSVVLR